MEYPCSPFSHRTYHFDVISTQSPISFVPYSPWDLDLARLRNEQEILENGLATYVIYLLALRKKLARNERSLNLVPPPTLTKRKKMEQSKRMLERETQNRKRDEQAFLNNLQACKTNMYLTGGLWNQSADVFSTMAGCTSSTTQQSCDESAPTEVSWNGWADDTASPFQKLRSKAVVLKAVAPNEQDHHDNSAIQTRSLSTRVHEPILAVSVSQDYIGFKVGRSSLSPEATVFEPIVHTTGQDNHPQIKHSAFAKGGKDLQMRRVTVASMHIFSEIFHYTQGLGVKTSRPRHGATPLHNEALGSTPGIRLVGDADRPRSSASTEYRETPCHTSEGLLSWVYINDSIVNMATWRHATRLTAGVNFPRYRFPLQMHSYSADLFVGWTLAHVFIACFLCVHLLHQPQNTANLAHELRYSTMLEKPT